MWKVLVIGLALSGCTVKEFGREFSSMAARDALV